MNVGDGLAQGKGQGEIYVDERSRNIVLFAPLKGNSGIESN